MKEHPLFSIRTNIMAMTAITNLNRARRGMAKSIERLSTGKRINRAADDAAGLAVAENLDAQGRSVRIARRNAMDGIAVLQVAEGGMDEVSNIVKRMRELAIEAATETLGSTERAYVQDEYVQLAEEVNRIGQTLEFNGVPLGAGGSLSVFVGPQNSAANRIPITLTDLSATNLGVDTGSVSMATAGGAQSALSVMDTALDMLNRGRSQLGAKTNVLQSRNRFLETYGQALSSAQSTIEDADYARESAEYAKYQIMSQVSTAVLAQANQMSRMMLSLIGG